MPAMGINERWGNAVAEFRRPCGFGYSWTPGIHSRNQIEGWRLDTEAVHNAGGRIFLRLWHVGRISHPSLQPDGIFPVGHRRSNLLAKPSSRTKPVKARWFHSC
jgi:2,4-dienoyl-CoA reductase-like NADH-dependent reductase (Old Yellow Enzyme family)